MHAFILPHYVFLMYQKVKWNFHYIALQVEKQENEENYISVKYVTGPVLFPTASSSNLNSLHYFASKDKKVAK